MCKVLNARRVGRRSAPDRAYVGRPTKSGKPFVIGRNGACDQVIAKYRAWILRQPVPGRQRQKLAQRRRCIAGVAVFHAGERNARPGCRFAAAG